MPLKALTLYVLTSGRARRLRPLEGSEGSVGVVLLFSCFKEVEAMLGLSLILVGGVDEEDKGASFESSTVIALNIESDEDARGTFIAGISTLGTV